MLGHKVLSALPAHQAATLTGRAFFPHLIGAPFKHGLVLILSFAAVMSLVAALASALRGERFVHAEVPPSTTAGGRRPWLRSTARRMARRLSTGRRATAPLRTAPLRTATPRNKRLRVLLNRATGDRGERGAMEPVPPLSGKRLDD